jgi:hypothetical protein
LIEEIGKAGIPEIDGKDDPEDIFLYEAAFNHMLDLYEE